MIKVKKFFKENYFIVIPSSLIFLVLIFYLFFGLERPETNTVYSLNSITQEQVLYEEKFLEDYELNQHNETNPFVVLNPYEISPLTALLVFETDAERQFKIVVEGLESEGDLEFTSISSTMHYIPVYGLYANHINKVRLYEVTTTEELITTIEIETEPLPEEITLPSIVTTTHDYFGDDLMMVIPALNAYPMAVDYNGDVRWYLTKNLTWSPTILENGRLLLGSDRLMSDPYYVTGMYEMDYLGKVYREYKVPGGYHHDIVELPSNNFLVLTSDFDGTVEDVIVEVDRTTGEVIETWDLKQFLNTFDGMAEMWTTSDWFHNNSIDYNPVTDEILLSGRHQDAVISIDKTNKVLNYIIGDPENWSSNFVSQYFFTPVGDDFEWQYAQHSAMFLPNGDIFLFDNGNNKAKNSENYVDANDSYSRGVVYSINQNNMTISQVFEYGKELGRVFYSPYISNVDYYGDSHYMIHSGGHATVGTDTLNIPGPLYDDQTQVVYNSITVELKDDNVEFYMEIPDNYYQAEKISLYSVYTSYRTGEGVQVGELAETERYNEDIDIRFSLLDTVPPLHELSFKKEVDRLVMDITLDRNDDVYLVLVNDTERITYKIPTSRTSYTAMCTATFQGDERQITYYINETNLSGDYDLYIIINNREYRTYKHVKFE